MSNSVDKSLEERLQALRGDKIKSPNPAANPVSFDVIERKKSPTRGDALAARLKLLRDSPSTQSSSAPDITGPKDLKHQNSHSPQQRSSKSPDAEGIIDTDTGSVVHADNLHDNTSPPPPNEIDVQALLEQLAASVPQDETQQLNHDEPKYDSDDSDGEAMKKEVKDVVDRYHDEAELDDGYDEIALPSVPSNFDLPPRTTSEKTPDMDEMAARMAALRTNDILPSVPTSQPSKKINRLTSTTNYTDDDVDSWCIVCLEDASLRCIDCDGDVYCTRCWKDMHLGPGGMFDGKTHRAVQFTRDAGKETDKKVALGA